MKDLYTEPEYNSISEAQRYVENARTTLRENGKLDTKTGCYSDPKYVRAAGNYLWLGVLTALDAVFHVKKANDDRVDIDDYRSAVSKRDLKMLVWINNAYKTMHLSMNYDGNQDKGICDSGFRIANQIIDRCATMISQA